MFVASRRSVIALVCAASCLVPLPAAAAPKQPRRPAVARAEPIDPVAVAAGERDALIARIGELEAIQGVEHCARWLSGQAWDTQDPWIHLMAARTWLKVQTSTASLDRAAFHAREAVALADASPVPRIAAADVARVHAESASLQRSVTQRRAEIRRARADRRAGDRQIRRGRRELVAGGAMMVVAALGGGLALGGASSKRRFDEAIAPVLAAGLPVDLAPLRALDVEGDRMLIAGAVLAAIGVAAGVPLLVLGGRDVRLGRRLRGGLSLQPGLGSLSLVGRFGAR
ncbi:hypothetical protein [Nannocystis bainbridge]|uniref:Uncharacterized protein n=1 Tax=Nannocystis bainbridge TaxID=2995303 RepID=A0ABT5DR67_9BACT|nr:hypothetical protein [Nannocystis bainbridge]MDC0716108.1 hypothetical protein [Nannocystis bainbridge]